MTAMYAVVLTGGKQYRVSQGDTIAVEKLEGHEGDVVEIPSVLMVGEGNQVTVGQPGLAQVRVVTRIVKQTRGPKIIIYKHKRRKGYQKKQGHRQWQTWLRVTEIITGDAARQGLAVGPTAFDEAGTEHQVSVGTESTGQ